MESLTIMKEQKTGILQSLKKESKPNADALVAPGMISLYGARILLRL